MLNMMVRFNSEVESNIVAVERIKEYAEVEQEAAWDVPDQKPDPAWPTKGQVKMEAYATRYRPGLDLVLKGVDCDIKGGEKVRGMGWGGGDGVCVRGEGGGGHRDDDIWNLVIGVGTYDSWFDSVCLLTLLRGQDIVVVL